MSDERGAGAREAILASATELIRRRGVSGMAISDVIAASGTSAGAIYHHFGSKEHLVMEVAIGVVARPMQLILATTPGLQPADLFEAAIDRVALDPAMPELLLQIWAGAQGNRALADLFRSEAPVMKGAIAELLGRWCDDNGVDLDPIVLVETIISLVMGYVAQQALLGEMDLAAYRANGHRLLVALSGQKRASVG